MLIKTLLIICFTFLILYFGKNSEKTKARAWKKIFFMLFLILGIIFAIRPDLINDLAKSIGVGRGADLVLYCVVVAFIFVTINVYLKFKRLNLRIDKLVSQIAQLESNKKDQD